MYCSPSFWAQAAMWHGHRRPVICLVSLLVCQPPRSAPTSSSQPQMLPKKKSKMGHIKKGNDKQFGRSAGDIEGNGISAGSVAHTRVICYCWVWKSNSINKCFWEVQPVTRELVTKWVMLFHGCGVQLVWGILCNIKIAWATLFHRPITCVPAQCLNDLVWFLKGDFKDKWLVSSLSEEIFRA